MSDSAVVHWRTERDGFLKKYPIMPGNVGGALSDSWHVQLLVWALAHTRSSDTRLRASSGTLQDVSSLFNGVVSVSLEMRRAVMQ